MEPWFSYDGVDVGDVAKGAGSVISIYGNYGPPILWVHSSLQL